MELAQEAIRLLEQYPGKAGVIDNLNARFASLSLGSIHSGRNTSIRVAPIVILQGKVATDQETRDKCIQQLSPSLPLDDRTRLINAKGPIISQRTRYKEYFQWIMESAEYHFWERESSGTQLLWIYGPPATGKTMFSLFLTQELEKKNDQDSVVLYYFCIGRELDRRSPTSVLRGLMKLFISKNEQSAGDLVPDFRCQGPALFGQIFALWRIFRNMVNNCSYRTVYCVIDGLDECSESSVEQLENFVNMLKNDFDVIRRKQVLGVPNATAMDTETITTPSSKLPAFKLAVVSRDEPSFLKKLEVFTHIQISKNESNQDNLFRDDTHKESSEIVSRKGEISKAPIEDAMTDSSPLLRLPDVSPKELPDPEIPQTQDTTGRTLPSNALELYIRERIVNLSQEKQWDEATTRILEERLRTCNDGTFLWVEAAVDVLGRLKTREAREISWISRTTQSMWCDILSDIPYDLRPPARFLLKWLSLAFVPLQLSQLQEVWCFISRDRYFRARHIIREASKACGILLERGVEGDANITHTEVKNFLTTDPSSWGATPDINNFFFSEGDGHSEIAKISVNYLEQSIFQHDACIMEIANGTRQVFFPDHDDYTVRRPFIQYSARFWPEHAKKATSGAINFGSPFFSQDNIARQNWYRAAWGIECHIHPKHCPKFQSRLHVAAFFDLAEWALYLCSIDKRNHQMEARSTDLLTPLFVAAARESIGVFTVLLDHGAEKTIMDENVFHFACRVGSRRIVSLLLQRNADANETTSAVGLLQCLTAAFRILPGLSGIVNMRQGKDWKDILFMQFFGEKTTPLHNAVLGEHEDIVEMLLAHKADVNLPTLENGTAAHIAAWKGAPSMLELLKKYGADFSQRTSTGWYPIHCAAVHGNEAAIQWLINNGASVDSITTAGETPLHLAAQYGLDHTAKVLLDSKAAVNAKTVGGLTPLHIAAETGRDNVVTVLLIYNADQELMTKDGKTALRLAEHASRDHVVRILKSAKLVERNGDGTMTSEENFGIPHIGVPHVELPPVLLNAIETGLSMLGSRRTKEAQPCWTPEDGDDQEQPRHYSRHRNRHHYEKQ